MLYIINKSSLPTDAFCLIKTDDVILLIEDGVYINNLNMTENSYALKSDVIARGLLDKISSQIKLIDYEGFVELAIQHYPIINL
jgi:tRNA 2-thiouridine synthesizing protein B